MRKVFSVRFGVGGRLYALVALFVVGSAVLAGVLIWLQNQRAIGARQDSLTQLVDVAIGVLDAHRKLAEGGAISQDEAKARAFATLNALRYGKDDYFFIQDTTGVMLLNPNAPGAIGKNRMGNVDSRGRYFNRDMVEKANSVGSGFVTYFYAKPGSEAQIEKTAYVKLYKPWGLIVATAVYMDDVEAEIRGAVIQGAVATLLLAFLLGGVVFWMARGIARPLGRLRTAMLDLAAGHEVTVKLDLARRDEIGEMAKAVEVFREHAIARATLEQKAQTDAAERAALDEKARAEAAERAALMERSQADEAARNTRTQALIGEFRSSVRAVLSAVGTNMTKLETTASSLTGVANEASTQASAAAEASEQAAGNVQSVASATDELGSSVAEIGRQVQQANSVVEEATRLAARSNGQIATLAEAAQKIGNVVELINSIAAQTNLLALNATIEAARAGEAGKGFAVVASEVKTLAGQTAKATEEIGAQVSGIQASTREAVEAIGKIAATMEEIGRFTSSIAATIDQQAAATSEISRNVANAAQGTGTVAANISTVTMAIGEASRSAGQVLGASGELAKAASHLQSAVDGFLTEVAA